MIWIVKSISVKDVSLDLPDAYLLDRLRRGSRQIAHKLCLQWPGCC